MRSVLLPRKYSFFEKRFWQFSCSFCLLLFGLLRCRPADTVGLENPPCVVSIAPAPQSTSIELTSTFRVKFSKGMNPLTLNTANVYLVQGEVDALFLRDVELPPLSDSRLARLVPIKLQTLPADNTMPDTIVIEPEVPLTGETTYVLILSRGLRDAYRQISPDDIRFTGSRPLGQCADPDGVWVGDLDEYRRGRSLVATFKTGPAPPRPGQPKIVEVMAEPKVMSGEFIEIQNISTTESTEICGLFLDDGGTPRQIIAFDDSSCPALKPGQRGLLLEPDYDLSANPYKIPETVPLFTTRGSSSTLLSNGIFSIETLRLSDGKREIDTVAPRDVTGSVWPSSKSLEKCDPKGENVTGNWKEGGELGTPGVKNACTP